MIRYAHVVVRYPRAREAAVRDVSLEALRGRVTVVVGPNGSGKSTLVRALLRLLALESGDITVDGVSLRALVRRDLARRVAVVPQQESLVFSLPVREYVGLGRYPHQASWGAPGGDDERAVDDAMRLAGVTPLAGRRTHELSGGEWQRVRLARAIAQGGQALVLDEPTTFLDIAHEMATFELLARLAAGGTAVLCVSHQLNLAARFAHHMVLLHRGRVAAAGSPGDVMRASVLEPVYGWPLLVTRDPAVGAPALLPLRRDTR